MSEVTEMSNIEKLREAWENAPVGAKNRVYNHFGYTNQNVSDVLKNGRKDESIILSLLAAIKQASKDITATVVKQNETVQAL